MCKKQTTHHERIDDLDWDKFPSYGPFTEEEAFARIEKAEEEMNDPSKWVTSEEVHKYLHEKFPWLRWITNWLLTEYLVTS